MGHITPRGFLSCEKEAVLGGRIVPSLGNSGASDPRAEATLDGGCLTLAAIVPLGGGRLIVFESLPLWAA